MSNPVHAGSATELFERPPYRRNYDRVPDSASTLNTGEREDVLVDRGEPLFILPAFLMRPYLGFLH